MIELKICGLRRFEDIDYVNQCAPRFVGFILSQGYRRSVTLEDFRKLRFRLDSRIKAVGVFVDEDIEYIRHFAPLLDVIQLHGNEDNSLIAKLKFEFSCEVWKAVRARSSEDIELADKLLCDRLLIDSYVENAVGGTGEPVDVSLIRNANFHKDYLVAGGVNANNVEVIIQLLRKKPPCGIDLSSSLETGGYKDISKIKQITNAIRLL